MKTNFELDLAKRYGDYQINYITNVGNVINKQLTDQFDI